MAHEIYLKLEGPEIKGEATSKGYEKQIVIDDFSYSIEAASPDGRGSGSPTISTLDINKRLDKSSPKFAIAAFNRTKFKKGTIKICKISASRKKEIFTLLKCCFTNLTCLGYDFSGQDHSTENVKFKFDIIETTYVPIDPYKLTADDGKIFAKLDRKKNSSNS